MSNCLPIFASSCLRWDVCHDPLCSVHSLRAQYASELCYCLQDLSQRSYSRKILYRNSFTQWKMRVRQKHWARSPKTVSTSNFVSGIKYACGHLRVPQAYLDELLRRFPCTIYFGVRQSHGILGDDKNYWLRHASVSLVC